MLEVLKGAGRYPSSKNVVCTCWRHGEGYWYLIEDEPKLSAMSPAERGRHIISRLPERLMATLHTGTQEVEKRAHWRVCSLVNTEMMDLHWIDAVLDDAAPSAEATCERLAELLGGEE